MSGTASYQGKTKPALKLEVRDAKGNLIAGIESMSIQENRQLTRIRHLEISRGGETIDVVPGVTEKTININGIVFFSEGGYLKDTFNRLDPIGSSESHADARVKGYYNLSDQLAGFDIYESTLSADGNYYTTIHPNCWVQSRGRNMTIQGDVKVAETITVMVGGNSKEDYQTAS